MFAIDLVLMLFMCAVWLDLRTQSTVERLINNTPGRNKNHLKVKRSQGVHMTIDTWILLSLHRQKRLKCCRNELFLVSVCIVVL